MAAWYRYRCRPESASPEWWADPAAACRYRYGPEHSHVPDFPASEIRGHRHRERGKFITLRLLVPLHVRHADVFIRRTFTRMNTIHLRLAVNVSSPEKRTRVVAVLPASAFCRSSSSYQNSSRPGTQHCPRPQREYTKQMPTHRCKSRGLHWNATERPFSPYLSRQHTTREQ